MQNVYMEPNAVDNSMQEENSKERGIRIRRVVGLKDNELLIMAKFKLLKDCQLIKFASGDKKLKYNFENCSYVDAIEFMQEKINPLTTKYPITFDLQKSSSSNDQGINNINNSCDDKHLLKYGVYDELSYSTKHIIIGSHFYLITFCACTIVGLIIKQNILYDILLYHAVDSYNFYDHGLVIIVFVYFFYDWFVNSCYWNTKDNIFCAFSFIYGILFPTLFQLLCYMMNSHSKYYKNENFALQAGYFLYGMIFFHSFLHVLVIMGGKKMQCFGVIKINVASLFRIFLFATLYSCLISILIMILLSEISSSNFSSYSYTFEWNVDMKNVIGWNIMIAVYNLYRNYKISRLRVLDPYLMSIGAASRYQILCLFFDVFNLE